MMTGCLEQETCRRVGAVNYLHSLDLKHNTFQELPRVFEVSHGLDHWDPVLCPVRTLQERNIVPAIHSLEIAREQTRSGMAKSVTV